MQDMRRKGRDVHGEKVCTAKLTARQVRTIRGKYKRKVATQKELAAKYGVRQAHISRIVRGTAWQHLPT